MMKKFFESFPTVEYGTSKIKDTILRITSKATVLDKLKLNPYVFYPKTLTENERIDNVANDLFDDPYLGWILMLSNDVIDPYYDWYVDSQSFDQMIIKKYGSIEEAKNKILFYRNDWYKHTEDKISISQYNTLSFKEYKYWEPVYINSKVSHYKRKQIDMKANTNIVVKYTVASTTNFVKGNRVLIKLKSDTFGYGEIIQLSSDSITIQHVSGIAFETDTVEIQVDSYIKDLTTEAQTIISDISVIYNISELDQNYFEAVTAYEFENEQNEYNKTIRVIDNSLIPKIITELPQRLKAR